MTRMIKEKVKCAVCHHKFEANIFLSSNSSGRPDLDFRPNGMMRTACVGMVTICPKCGYANSQIEKLISDNVKDIMDSEQYRYYRDNIHIEKARANMLCGYLNMVNGFDNKAVRYFLTAAWVFDDYCDETWAITARKEAIACLLKGKNNITDFYYKALLIDMNRRIGAFKEAEELIDEYLPVEEDADNVKYCKFQKELCAAKDSEAHNCSEFLD